MERLFRAYLKEFWGGAFVGGTTGSVFLFPAPLLLKSFLLAYIIKIIGTGILAGISGLCTILAVDFYKHKIKDKLFGNKNGK